MGKGDIAAIEVELTPKKPHELQEILQELVKDYQEVRYFVTKATADAVVAAQKKLDPSQGQRILICFLGQYERLTEHYNGNKTL